MILSCKWFTITTKFLQKTKVLNNITALKKKYVLFLVKPAHYHSFINISLKNIYLYPILTVIKHSGIEAQRKTTDCTSTNQSIFHAGTLKYLLSNKLLGPKQDWLKPRKVIEIDTIKRTTHLRV